MQLTTKSTPSGDLNMNPTSDYTSLELPSPFSLYIAGDEWSWDEGTELFDKWEETHLNDSTTGMLEEFVTTQIPDKGKATRIESGVRTGSFNQIFRFTFEDETDVILRMPKPGHSVVVLMEEKVRNEVAWMKCFKEKTSMRIAHIYSFSVELPKSEWPFGLPFILMEFLKGKNLRDFLVEDLPDAGESEESDALRTAAYEDVARFLIELRSISLDQIGSITQHASNEWVVTERPLTMDMETAMCDIPNYPVERWSEGPFTCCSDYVKYCLSRHPYLLKAIRNINMPHEKNEGELKQKAMGIENIDFKEVANTARARFLSCPAFAKMATELYNPNDEYENGPFLPSNADLDPRNMLVDPDTGKVIGMVDLEFNNAMPARYSHDPPQWLVMALPKKALEMGFFEWWKGRYEVALDHFLNAMKTVEERMENKLDCAQKPLSELMRESYDSGAFWINMGLENIALVDTIYWEIFYRSCPRHRIYRAPYSDDEVEREMAEYVKFSEGQIVDYERTREEKKQTEAEAEAKSEESEEESEKESEKQEDEKQEDEKQESEKQEDEKQEDEKQEDEKQEDEKQEDEKQEDEKQEDEKQEDEKQEDEKHGEEITGHEEEIMIEV